MAVLRFLFIFAITLFLWQCSSKQLKRGSFSYQKVVAQSYAEGQGGVIPLTIDKGESFGGQISADGNFLFFASNKLGNYDIFVRDLSGVSVTPIVKTATNQREPVISPDGRLLLYIDDELDPDGDLIMREIEIEKYIAYEQQSGEGSGQKYLKKPLILTNDEVKRVRSRESNPTWSNSGQHLAFSSDMLSVEGDAFGPGLLAIQNIWVAPRDDFKSARKITSKGGVMPSFSPDDRHIIYISYENSQNNGDIFEVEVATGKVVPLYVSRDLKLNPSYTPDGRFIIFTKISQDTNGDGVIDRKDYGQIVKIERKPFEEGKFPQITELTLGRQNVFDTRVSRYLGGSVIFALGSGEDINIAMILLDGAIAKKQNIVEQFGFLNQYYPKDFASSEYDSRRTISKANEENWLKDQRRFRLQNNQEHSMAHENYLLAMKKFADFYGQDDLFDIFHVEVQLRRFDFLLKTFAEYDLLAESWQRLKSIIDKPQSVEQVYARALVDLYINRNVALFKRLAELDKNTVYRQFIFGELLKHRSLHEGIDYDYLTKFFQSKLFQNVLQAQLAATSDEAQKNKITKKSLQLHSHLLRLQARYIASRNAAKAAELYQELITSNPDYFDLAAVILAKGDLEKKDRLATEYVYLLDVQTNTAPEYIKAGDEKFINATHTQTKKTLTASVRDRVEKNIFAFFYDNINAENRGTVDAALQVYTEAKNKTVNMLGNLAYGEYYTEKGDFKSALKHMQLIKNNIPSRTIWQFYFTRIYGSIRELLNEPAQGFLNYYTAILEYEGRFDYEKILPFIDRLIAYYERAVDRFLKRADYDKAWLIYQLLMGVYLDLYGKDVAREAVNRKALKTYLQINSMAIESLRLNAEKLRQSTLMVGGLDTSLIDKIDDFYKLKIPVAYQQLNNEFIFARANLKTQYGVFLQKHYENKSMGNKEKERILKMFKEAEEDLRWSFFANPNSANSYLLLGWMYQFIDENKENIVNTAKKTKDKDEFSRLYNVYFPHYLFEENIRLYQKSIGMFQETQAQGVIGNLNLNIGNNYFLLNNYNKAEESYEKVLEEANAEGGSLEFESELQRAAFYFHLGKTYYFTAKYQKSVVYLKKTLEMYEKLAPIINVDKEALLENQKKREIIYKYLALSYEYNDKADEAIKIYQTLLKEKSIAANQEDASLVYLELARLYYDKKEYESTLQNLTRAEAALKTEAKVELPRYYFRIMWFIDFRLPFYSWGPDMVYQGENRIVFKLPTIHRYEYLHSLRASAYKSLGNYPETKQHLGLLIKAADDEDNSHGLSVMNNAYLRLAVLEFENGEINLARQAFETALKLATKRKDTVLQTSIRQNLYFLLCFEIENKVFDTAALRNTLTATIKDMNEFIETYEKEQLKTTQKKVEEDTNRSTLTEAEIKEVKLNVAKSVNRLLLYKSIFESYIAQLDLDSRGYQAIPQSEEQNSFSLFLQQEFQYFQMLNKPINRFSGFLFDDSKEPQSNFLQNRDLRLRLILTLNRGRIYRDMNLPARALSEFQQALELADEFQDDLFMAAAHFQIYWAKKSLSAADYPAHLEAAAKIFTDNFQLVNERPDLYIAILEEKLETAAAQQNVDSVLQTAEALRFARSWPHIYRNLSVQEPQMSALYTRLRQINTVQNTLAQDIAALRYSRLDSKYLENIYKNILNDKSVILRDIKNYKTRPSLSLMVLPEFNNFDAVYAKRSMVYFSRYKNTLLVNVVQTDGAKAMFALDISGDKLKLLQNSVNAFDEVSEQTPGWIKAIVSAQPQIVVANVDTLNFSFEKLIKTPFVYSTSLRAIAAFQLNQRILATHNINIALANEVAVDKNAKNIINDATQVRPNAVKMQHVITQKTTPHSVLKNASALFDEYVAPAMVTVYEPKLAVITLEEFDIRNAEMLMFATAGSSIVTYKNFTDAKVVLYEQEPNLLNVIKEKKGLDLYKHYTFLSGNLDVLHLLWRINERQTTVALDKEWASYIEREQQFLKQSFNTLMTSNDFRRALQVIERRENLQSFDAGVRKTYFQNEIASLTADDFELQLAKVRLLLVQKNDSDAFNEGKQIISRFASVRKKLANPRDKTKEEILIENSILRYLAVLFEFGHYEHSFKLLANELAELVLQRSNVANYYFLHNLYLVNQGNYNSFYAETKSSADEGFVKLAEKVGFVLPATTNQKVLSVLNYSSKSRVWKNFHNSLGTQLLLSARDALDKQLDPVHQIIFSKLFDDYVEDYKNQNVYQNNDDKNLQAFFLSGSFEHLAKINLTQMSQSLSAYLNGYYYYRQKNYSVAITHYLEAVSFTDDFSLVVGDLALADLRKTLLHKKEDVALRQVLLNGLLQIIDKLPAADNPQRENFVNLHKIFHRSFSGYSNIREDLQKIGSTIHQLSFVNQRLYLDIIVNLFFYDPKSIKDISFVRFKSNAELEKIQSMLARVQQAIKEDKFPEKIDDVIEYKILANVYFELKNQQRLLQTILKYDRNEKIPASSPEQNVVIGFAEAFENKLFFWQFIESKVIVESINYEQVPLKIQNFALRDRIMVYLNNRLKSIDILQYSQLDTFIFTATINPKPIFFSSPNLLTSWASSQTTSTLKFDPLQSIMKIYLGQQEQKNSTFLLKDRPLQVPRLINIYSPNFQVSEFSGLLNSVEHGNWHILSTDKNRNNVFLSFLSEYLNSFQSSTVKRKDGSIDLVLAFIAAKKKVKNNFRLAEDYNSVILVLN